MNQDSPFETWRLANLKQVAVSPEILELLALAFEGGRLSKREWRGLTDEEVKEIIDKYTIDDHGFEIWCDGLGVIKAVEDKLRSKNT